jgi:hypothetical protein
MAKTEDLVVTIRVDTGEAKKALAQAHRKDIFQAITTEREYQDQKWGGPQHDDTHSAHDWVTYIVKYLGKWQAWPAFSMYDFRRSMVKVAALAVAAIEWADRRIAKDVQGKGDHEDGPGEPKPQE